MIYLMYFVLYQTQLYKSCYSKDDLLGDSFPSGNFPYVQFPEQ